MTKLATPATILTVLIALALPAAPAHAQLARTYVSSASGNDVNNCDRSTPCRTFQRAHDNTLANGEITVLDPGGYGAVTINRTISIINDGVGEAGVLVSGGLIGITIAAGTADAVSLRGLTVKGIGFGGGSGIQFNSGKSLTIENCAIRNLPNGGIIFSPNATSHLVVSNTFVADNAPNAGIRISPTGSGAVTAVLNRIESHNNGTGVGISGNSSTGTVKATVSDSVASNNTLYGFIAGSSGTPTDLMLVRSVSAHNDSGVFSTGVGATARVGQSTITGNATSMFQGAGSVLRSYGDNNINGNGDGDPAPMTIAKK